MRSLLRATPIVAALALLACAGGRGNPATSSIVLGSTTSTQDSGLFDVLIPAFEKAHPRYPVKVVAVGTGEALAMGRRKDADVLLVHAPAAESAFVAGGYGKDRRAVMHDDFLIVGPAADPAGVRGDSDAVDAFRRIARSGARFVSRGDDSGTNKKELALWKLAGIAPGGAWYERAGQGMGAVLQMADQQQAYTLTDRPSWEFLSANGSVHLPALSQGDPRLFNPYSVILVVGARNAAGARAFADWITSPAGQRVIADYGRAGFGHALFHADAVSGGR